MGAAAFPKHSLIRDHLGLVKDMNVLRCTYLEILAEITGLLYVFGLAGLHDAGLFVQLQPSPVTGKGCGSQSGCQSEYCWYRRYGGKYYQVLYP